MNTESPRKKKFRLRVLIYPEFQFTLIAVQLVLLLILFSIIYHQINLAFYQMFRLGVDQGIPASHGLYSFLNLQKDNILNYLYTSFFIGVILSSFVTLYISFKLAGPIVRLKSYFRDLGRGGKYHSLKFRPGDFFGDLPEAINDALEKKYKD